MLECEQGFHYSPQFSIDRIYFNHVTNIFDMYLVGRYFGCVKPRDSKIEIDEEFTQFLGYLTTRYFDFYGNLTPKKENLLRKRDRKMMTNMKEINDRLKNIDLSKQEPINCSELN